MNQTIWGPTCYTCTHFHVGGPSANRTHDPEVASAILYQLSLTGLSHTGSFFMNLFHGVVYFIGKCGTYNAYQPSVLTSMCSVSCTPVCLYWYCWGSITLIEMFLWPADCLQAGVWAGENWPCRIQLPSHHHTRLPESEETGSTQGREFPLRLISLTWLSYWT